MTRAQQERDLESLTVDLRRPMNIRLGYLLDHKIVLYFTIRHRLEYNVAQKAHQLYLPGVDICNGNRITVPIVKHSMTRSQL